MKMIFCYHVRRDVNKQHKKLEGHVLENNVLENMCWKTCVGHDDFACLNVRRSVKTPQDKKCEDRVVENNVSFSHSQSITKLSKKK